mmetsp:Transcript_15938/g.24644  ORF Transcript_15938/g.24644 Transcript_15938/m.24644 type:complete len:95 (+) Transcript_15938:374-658(+)
MGDEENVSDKLDEFWYKLADNNQQIVKSWSWGMIYGFFYENSIYNAAPLYDFIEDYFQDAKVMKHLSIGIANVLNGQFKTLRGHHEPEEMVKGL